MSKSIFDQLTQADSGPATSNPATSDSATSGLDNRTEKESTEPETNSADQPTAEPDRTPGRIREVAQNLLAAGLIEQSDKPNQYRQGITHLDDINRILEPLDLHARADEIRGLLFLLVRKDNLGDEDEWAHPLVRKQRLTLEQSLLVAILRQHFVNHEQEHGIGVGDAVVNIDELSSHLQMYLGDPGSEAKERNRTLQLIEQLKGHGLVTAPDSHDRVGIRPLIAHLASPENLQALLRDLQQMAQFSDDNARNDKKSNSAGNKGDNS